MGDLDNTSDADFVEGSKLLLLLLHRHCCDEKYHFKLYREDDNGNISGFIFEYKENDVTVYRVLQVHHLQVYSGGDFDLIKNFISYQSEIKYHPKNGKIMDYVICTNLSIDLKKKIKIDFERVDEADSIFDIEYNGEKSIKFRVKNPTENVGQIKDELKKYMKQWQGVIDKRSSQPEPSTKDIEDYSKSLIFILNLPNGNDLDKILENEIFKKMRNNDFYDRILIQIYFTTEFIDWIEAKSCRDFWTHEDAKDLFDNFRLGFNDVQYNVRTPVSLFTGREECLKNVHRKLQEEKQVVIHGIGGVGKTELARKYIELYGKKYNDNILWINAENDNTLLKSFRSLASNILKVKTINENGEEKKARFIIQEVFDWFQKSKSLFILDNAVYSHYQNYIEPCLSKTAYQPYIIITSRSKWENESSGNHVKLSAFLESEAINFIRESLPEFLNNDRQGKSVEELAKKLQYFPLALEQACAYINTEFEYEAETYQISEYIENLQVNYQEYLDYSLRDYCENGYDKTVWKTWDITIEALEKEENYALKLLNCMSFLSLGYIHANLLSIFFNEEQKLQQSIQLLKKYSLVTEQDDVYRFNPLVQLVIREKLNPDEKEEVLERILKAVMILFDKDRYKETYVLRVETLKLLMNPLFLEDERGQQCLQNISSIIVKFICNIDEHKQALNEAKKILKILKDINKPLANTSSIFSIETDIISLCLQMTDVQSAIEFFNESSLIKVAGAEEHHLAIMLRMEILGDIYVELSEYDSALKIYCTIYDRRKNNSSKGDSHILRIIKKIASALSEVHITKRMKRTCRLIRPNLANEILLALKKTYKDQKKIDPNNQNDMLDTQECIINVLIGQGKYKEASSLLKKIPDERLKRNNFNMLAKKASVFALLGKNDNALATCEDLNKHILMLESEDFKDIYPSIVHARVRLALVKSLLGKVDEALMILEEIWDGLKYSIGFYNLQVMNILRIISNLYLRKDEIDELIQCSEFIKWPNLRICEICSFKMPLQFLQENIFRTVEESIQYSKLPKALNFGGLEICSSAMQPQFLQEKALYDSTSQLPRSYNFDNLKMQRKFFSSHDDAKYGSLDPEMLIKNMFNENKFLDNYSLNECVGSTPKEVIMCKNRALSKAIRLSETKNPFVTVKTGNLYQLQKLIEKGVDVNTEDKNKWTLLHHAASRNKPSIVEYLLKNGADANRVTKESERTALHIAVKKNYFNTVHVLLLNCSVKTSKMLINAQMKKDGVTALHIASKEGSLDMLRLLLSHGAIYDMKNKAGELPIQMARDIIVGAVLKEIDMRFRFFETFQDDRALKPLKNYPENQYFAVFGARNFEGYSLLQLAVLKNCKNLVELILNFKARISSTITSLDISQNTDSLAKFDRKISNLLRDCNDEISNVEYLNQMNSFVQFARTQEKSELWQFLVSTIEDLLNLSGCNELVKFVIELQLKQLIELWYGALLIDAARKDDLKTFELCLEKTNFLDSSDITGMTPIRYAAMIGNKKMVELLLERNVKIHCTSLMQETPLHLAVENQHTEIAKLLLERDSSYEFINSTDPETGSTALHLAVENDHLEMVKLLLEHHADYSITDDDDLRPGELVMEKNIKDLFELIDELHENADAEQVLKSLSKMKPAERRPLLNAISAQGKMLRDIIIAKCKDKKKISDVIGDLSQFDNHSQADLARKLLDVMLEITEKYKSDDCYTENEY